VLLAWRTTMVGSHSGSDSSNSNGGSSSSTDCAVSTRTTAREGDHSGINRCTTDDHAHS
jgi:hypothetical protein